MLIGSVRSIHRYPVKSFAGETLDESYVADSGLLGDRAYAVRDDVKREIRSARNWPRLMQASARFAVEPRAGHTPAAELTLPDGTHTTSDAPEVSRKISDWLGVPASLCALRPASDREHYRRHVPGASVAGVLARSSRLKKIVARAAQLGPGGADLRHEFGREAGEPLPDLSVFPADVFAYATPPGTYFDAFPIHFITSASLEALRAKSPDSDWDTRRFRANFVIDTLPVWTGLVESGWAERRLRIGELEIACTVATPRCSMPTQPQPGLQRDTTVLRTIVREAAQNFGMYANVVRPGVVKAGDSVELL